MPPATPDSASSTRTRNLRPRARSSRASGGVASILTSRVSAVGLPAVSSATTRTVCAPSGSAGSVRLPVFTFAHGTARVWSHARWSRATRVPDSSRAARMPALSAAS